jgi:MFS family permease
MLASLLAVVAGVMPQFLTASMSIQIAGSFRFSHELLGVSVALFNLVGVGVAPLMNRVVSVIGIRTTLRLSATIACCTSLEIATVVSAAWQLVALLMIAGLTNAITVTAASALIRERVSGRNHGLGFGVQQAGAPTALLLAGLAVPLVSVPFGWRWAFAGLAVVALLAAISAPPVDDIASTAVWSTPRSRRPRPVLSLLVLAAAGASAVAVGVVSFLVAFATSAQISASMAGLLLGAVSLASMAGRIGFGLRVDRGQADPIGSAIPLLVACTIGVTLLVVGTPAAIVTGALIIGGLGWSWNGILTLAVVRDNADDPVQAVGMLMSGVFAGSVVGPLLVGFVASQISFRAAWSACALLSLVPVLALVSVRARRRRVPASLSAAMPVVAASRGQ